jgi:CRISPR-associated endonuclease/helicase Cas3
VSWLEQRAAELLARKPQAASAGGADEDAGTEAVESDAGAPETAPCVPATGKLERGDIVALVLSPGGDHAGHYTLAELAQGTRGKDKSRKDLQGTLVGKLIVVDARLGGLKDGLLSPASGDIARAADAFLDASEQEAEQEPSNWSAQAGLRVRRALSLPDGAVDGWRFEHRFARYRDAEGVVQDWVVVEHFKDAARKEDARSISKPQELGQPQSWAGRAMERIARSVGLPDAAVQALALGASLHDEGKKAERWQRAFKAARDARKHGLSLPLAKTRGPIDQAVLGGYRHELGSLLLLEGSTKARTENAELLKRLASFEALPEDWRDLVLHLVAAHHGQARPVIETRGCEDAPPSALEERARAVALRFARLQRRWGPWGLAWWEALLRAADQQASRRNDADGDGDAPPGGNSARATAES